MASLMLTKDKEALEWQKLLENFYSQLESNPHLGNVCQILALSFDDLPCLLKPCFLYFSIFPKDSLIPNDKLFKLWIAEGYIQEKGGKTLEEVAEEYMNELVRRNLVQACEGFYCLEKFCRVHSLMHDIARKKAEEFSFCQIQEDVNSNSRGKVRRLLISDIVVENALEIFEDSQLRSVFLRNIAALSNSSLVTLFGKYKLLTLLDFENTPLERLPNEVGNLIYRKYLSLKNTQVKMLPRSVGKLCNLQTLDIRNTLLIELPIEINKLQNLRHLLASGHDKKVRLDSTRGVRIKEGIGFLENLQTLMTVEAHHVAYDGDKLHFEEGAFKKLKLLVLRELHGLKVLEIDEGALPLLEELRIGPSPLLKEVPFGIQHLRNLKVLANYSMPSEFVLSMQPDGGSDYRKVEHVPSVLFWYRVQERSYISYKLGEPALLEHLQVMLKKTWPQSQPQLQLAHGMTVG
ncbi:disease resistance protein RPM1 [Morus notabilis]|uniref:disease resistance protein RPM1 n=1 Tax=Morus notabilis TaxID=981085 RepID=UPI000CED50D2|nr:disease resistance protein RPM1 [Morus notabilis]